MELESLKRKTKEDLWMDDLEEFMRGLEVGTIYFFY